MLAILAHLPARASTAVSKRCSCALTAWHAPLHKRIIAMTIMLFNVDLITACGYCIYPCTVSCGCSGTGALLESALQLTLHVWPVFLRYRPTWTTHFSSCYGLYRQRCRDLFTSDRGASTRNDNGQLVNPPSLRRLASERLHVLNDCPFPWYVPISTTAKRFVPFPTTKAARCLLCSSLNAPNPHPHCLQLFACRC